MISLCFLSTALCSIIAVRHEVAAFSSPPSPLATTRANHWSAAASSSSSTAINLFFGAYLPLGIPPALAYNAWVDSRRKELKERILQLASDTKRGLVATEEQAEEMQDMFAKLEKFNPTVNPITNKYSTLSGDWLLEYTTSDSILGKGGFERVGPIVQNIDIPTLSAKNSEVVKYVFANVPRSVSSELTPVNGKRTDVKFKRFELGPVGFDAPDSFRGILDITYLDDEVRLSRGDKGNIFVLTRM
mmetsp:Transcript_25489/g.61273  ORF Transcript_25489/g.61273 Transcript_25489/m.61273 type:complete len:245 (-) Transcript_25489:445-1179(-)|eukprot:CAMPEP_0181114458 /NCGR_PEP_ID=MMETSP1071-20121207/20904_1 /TAXON_ID=35127 /ORGANISM="Thalassiosira sp., Strain NH16" /LENGTH=244 /DNA_ID=CAMNT_0023198589 /DNA_START=85 /DNA_END=819 /DNA_ORIENTATION=+